MWDEVSLFFVPFRSQIFYAFIVLRWATVALWASCFTFVLEEAFSSLVISSCYWVKNATIVLIQALTQLMSCICISELTVWPPEGRWFFYRRRHSRSDRVTETGRTKTQRVSGLVIYVPFYGGRPSRPDRITETGRTKTQRVSGRVVSLYIPFSVLRMFRYLSFLVQSRLLEWPPLLSNSLSYVTIWNPTQQYFL